MYTVWRSADTLLEFSFVQHCDHKLQSTADLPQKRNSGNGMLCQIRHKLFSLPLCKMYVLAELNISFHLM